MWMGRFTEFISRCGLSCYSKIWVLSEALGVARRSGFQISPLLIAIEGAADALTSYKTNPTLYIKVNDLRISQLSFVHSTFDSSPLRGEYRSSGWFHISGCLKEVGRISWCVKKAIQNEEYRKINIVSTIRFISVVGTSHGEWKICNN